MPHTDPIPYNEQGMLDIAKKASRAVPKLLVDNMPNSAAMGEHFKIYVFGTKIVSSSEPAKINLIKLARPTGRWHHQIRIDGESAAIGVTIPLKDDQTKGFLCKFSVTPLAKRIDSAIDWLDLNIHEDFCVRLLVFPAYQMHTFWLLNENSAESFLLPIDFPPRYTRYQHNRLLSSLEFFQILKQVKIVAGIRLQ